jgi:phage shock protein PspC (stress-responsive transcriptional regulator)
MNNDTETMGTRGKGDEQSNEASGEPRPHTRRLLRSSNDRLVAGVAGGLGRYFDVDPVMFRIGFAVSVLFGGAGILAYAMLALFVPTDGEPDQAQRLGHRLQTAMGG